MEAIIQPINNPTFQDPGPAVENSPSPSKPFNQVLKEKTDAAHDPVKVKGEDKDKDKDKEKDPSAKPTQLDLLEFWVRFFAQEPIPLEQEVSAEVSGQPGKGVFVINGSPSELSNSALSEGEALFRTAAELALQAEASMNPESAVLVPPLEGQGEPKAAGSMEAKALFPFLTEEMAQVEKPMPDASKTLQGSGPEVSAEVSGQPGKGVFVINGSPSELSNSALSMGTEALSASITEEMAGVEKPMPEASRTLQSSGITEEMAGVEKSMPEALRTQQGSVSKEGSTHSSPNDLFAARGDSETRPLNPMLAPTGWQDNPPFFDKSTFQGPYPVADAFSNSSPVEPTLTHFEGPRGERKNPGMISQSDQSLSQEALAAKSLPDDGVPPAPSAEATPRPRPISSLEASQLVQRVGERIAWSAKNNQEVIRLSLEPPELGRLVIEIQKDRDQIKAALFADNSTTREILETHQFRLQKSLEENGFKLAQYDVFTQKDMGSFHQFEGNSVFRDGQERQPFPTPRPGPDAADPKETQERWTSGRPGSQVIDRWM